MNASGFKRSGRANVLSAAEFCPRMQLRATIRSMLPFSRQVMAEAFSADPHVLGKIVELDHKSVSVIGVAAPRFAWYKRRPLHARSKLSQDLVHMYKVDLLAQGRRQPETPPTPPCSRIRADCPRQATLSSGKIYRQSSGSQRLGGQEHRRNTLSALRRRGATAGNWLRQVSICCSPAGQLAA